MGRLLVFMARIGDLGQAPTLSPITGLGVDEETSIYIDGDGRGIVDGVGSVYVLREGASTARSAVACGMAVRYEGVERHRLHEGDTFDVSTGTSSVTPVSIGIADRFVDFYVPSDPY